MLQLLSNVEGLVPDLENDWLIITTCQYFLSTLNSGVLFFVGASLKEEVSSRVLLLLLNYFSAGFPDTHLSHCVSHVGYGRKLTHLVVVSALEFVEGMTQLS
jgi:hypothetical protein